MDLEFERRFFFDLKGRDGEEVSDFSIVDDCEEGKGKA